MHRHRAFETVVALDKGAELTWLRPLSGRHMRQDQVIDRRYCVHFVSLHTSLDKDQRVRSVILIIVGDAGYGEPNDCYANCIPTRRARVNRSVATGCEGARHHLFESDKGGLAKATLLR